jgi:acetylornithine deacetylase/succinyl-diaminopimelate desuccinylase-like protein
MLYGRGGADDGYSIFAICTALKILQEQQLPHQRCVFVMESAEESGSFDMNFYLDLLKDRIGNHVQVVSIVDSGCGNYDSLWLTSSLRGLI